jgi:hypothetical protein
LKRSASGAENVTPSDWLAFVEALELTVAAPL